MLGPLPHPTHARRLGARLRCFAARGGSPALLGPLSYLPVFGWLSGLGLDQLYKIVPSSPASSATPRCSGSSQRQANLGLRPNPARRGGQAYTLVLIPSN